MEHKEYTKETCGMYEGDCGQHSGMQCCGRDMRQGECGMGCRQMHGMRCGGRHFLLRWILGIAILAFVFGVGIKIGELKERMTGGYGNRYTGGYSMMQRGYGNGADAYYNRGGMMQGWINTQVPSAIR